eukprot:7072730-Pyramimonas_sp.AAC.1
MTELAPCLRWGASVKTSRQQPCAMESTTAKKIDYPGLKNQRNSYMWAPMEPRWWRRARRAILMLPTRADPY